MRRVSTSILLAFVSYLMVACANVPDEKGRERAWATDLTERMLHLQKKDGSWVNSNKKYWEGNPVLVTARAVISLNQALRAAGAIK